MDLPKISIITPNFNLGPFLRETIESVLSQQYPHLEYIIIDGGSTDDSLDIIREYENELSIWISEPDEGQYHALNKGFKLATGDVMGWLNSDDILYPEALKSVGAIFSTFKQVSWISSLVPGCIDEENRHLPPARIPGFSRKAFDSGFYSNQAYAWGSIQQESTFWRRSIWEKAGGELNTQYQFAADFELWSRFFGQTELIGVSQLLAAFRVRRGQKVQNSRYSEEQAMICQEMCKQGHDPSAVRIFLARAKLYETPVIRKILRTCAGFEGERIEPHKGNQGNQEWELVRYRFP